MVRIGRGRRGFEGLQVQRDLSLKDVVKKNRLMACVMQSTVPIIFSSRHIDDERIYIHRLWIFWRCVQGEAETLVEEESSCITVLLLAVECCS
jgi:hypothetical protein